MKVMVFDVPASSGGALTILHQYYEKAIKDTTKEWIFVVSTPELKEYPHIKVINFPWIKKSWFHRLYFDNFVAKKVVDKNKPDEILSLQNILIPRTEKKQTLYLHQSLPFAEKRYKITENFKFWIYQNILSEKIFKSIENADEIIVQTCWMRELVIDKTNVNSDKLVVETPEVNINVKKKYEKDNRNIFFYPAGAMDYKNHKVIIDACVKLKQDGIDNYEVVLTLNGDETNHIKTLYRITALNNLPVKFIGSISVDEVYEYYSKSILLFPSYIETFGLPILEVKFHDGIILVSDCPFSREILDNYKNVYYFNPFRIQDLAILMDNLIKGYINYFN